MVYQNTWLLVEFTNALYLHSFRWHVVFIYNMRISILDSDQTPT
jgi:hypothetical protein